MTFGTVFVSLLIISSATAVVIIGKNKSTRDFIIIKGSEDGQSKIALDTDFMRDIRQNLTSVIDDDHWQGREFGAPGEWLAAEILANAWNNHISNSNIGNAAKDRINKRYSYKIGIESQSDYKLIISGKEIPDSECFPIHTVITESDKYHNFINAEVHLTPGTVYGFEGGGSDGDAYREDDEDGYHIYLIEMEKCKEMGIYKINVDYSFYAVVNALIVYTVTNPDYPIPDAFLCADYNDDTHFMSVSKAPIPGMMINGSVGKQIKQKLENNTPVRVDFELHSHYFDNLESYNVIGTIPGKSNDITFIGAHYDSWWCQGAADDAGSMSVVWGIAKYFADNNIKPYHTLKFAAWGGEEYSRRGSLSYRSDNNDKIEYVVNIGAIGYRNGNGYSKEDTHLNIWHNRILSPDFQQIIDEINYPQLSGGYGGPDIRYTKFDPEGYQVWMTDAGTFVGYASGGVFSFDKGSPKTAGHWYHRNGEGHTKGDILEILDETDITATAEVILKVVVECSIESHRQSSPSTSQLPFARFLHRFLDIPHVFPIIRCMLEL